MKTKEQIVHVLQRNKAMMKKSYGVKSIALFGSWASGEQDSGSDIDLLVEFRDPTFSAWAGLKLFLEQQLQHKVDLITQGKHLSKRFLKHVNRAIVHV